jgi:hypothetical protein
VRANGGLFQTGEDLGYCMDTTILECMAGLNRFRMSMVTIKPQIFSKFSGGWGFLPFLNEWHAKTGLG